MNLSQIKLPPLKRTNANPSQWATVLVYAQARFGKTNLVRSCVRPDLGLKPIVIASEIGPTSGLGTLSDIDVPFIKVNSVDEMTLVLTELTRKAGKVQYQGEDFNVVFKDSLSSLGELWFEAALDVQGWDMAWDVGPDNKKDPRRPYAYVAEKGRQHMKLLMGTEAHLVCFAREAYIEEGEGNSKVAYVAPELPGAKLPRELPGWPDATFHGEVRNGVRVLCTKTIAKTVAGIRVPPSFEVPTFIKPDMPYVFDLVRGKKEALAHLKV